MTRKIETFSIGAILFFVLLCLNLPIINAQLRGCNPSVPLTAKDNAFHYRGGVLWLEWWTFNFYGPETKISAMINYIFVKAVDLAGVALVYPAFVIPETNQTYHTFDRYLLSHFDASFDTCHVKIDNGETKKSEIKYLDDGLGDVTSVVGATKDGIMEWDLQFERAKGMDPYCICNKTNLPLAFDFSWISHYPGAYVNGTVRMKDQYYQVKGFGESNHPWGIALEPVMSWTWAQSFNGEFGFYIVDAYGDGALRLSIPDSLIDHRTGGRSGISIGKEDWNDPSKVQVLTWMKQNYTLEQVMNTNSTSEQQYPIYTKIIANDPRIGSLDVVFYVTSASATTKGNASENNAHFILKLCLKGKQKCIDLESPGWSEYSSHFELLHKAVKG